MAIAESYIEYLQFRALVLQVAQMFDDQEEHGPNGRLMISAIKAAMAKVVQDVTLRAVHLHGSHGLSNIMKFGEYMVVALHEGAADGVTELHLANVTKLLLRGYKPRENSNLPSETVFLKRKWAEHQLKPLMDEIGVSFAESRGNIETDVPVEKYNLKPVSL